MHNKLTIKLLPGLFLLCMLYAVWLAYQAGHSGGLWFDDIGNLQGLASVHDFASAIEFVLKPQGGPGGRPIALASFLINAASWPNAIVDFLVTNTLIHLLNGVLVAWLVYKLCQLLPKSAKHPGWIAVTTAALWIAHPLLISASLMAVQRMATLCATFIFIGLILYAYGVANLHRAPRKAVLQLGAGIGAGTLLAVFTKENGILLPLLALVLDITLLHTLTARGTAPRWYRTWRILFLLAPIGAVVFYIGLKWDPFVAHGYAVRTFSLAERLYTQLHVLFDYLSLTYFPARSALGPIHDDYPISRGLLEPASTLWLLVFWLVLLASAILVRKKFPVFSFAVLWFLAAHSLESSIIPLEMYFEHRNYVPMLGPLLLLSYLIWYLYEKGYKAILLALGLFLLLELFVLHEATETWGNRGLAAKLWHERHPTSERASQFLSIYYSSTGQHREARDVIHEAYRNNLNKPGLAMQALQSSCGQGNERETLELLLGVQGRATFINGIAGTVMCYSADEIRKKVISGNCGSINSTDMQQLLDLALQNKRLDRSPDIKYCLHGNKAGYYFHDRNFSKTIEHLEIAYRHKPLAADAARIAEMLASGGLYDEALEKINHAIQHPPASTQYAAKWRERLAPVKQKIEAMRDESNRSATTR